MKKKILVILTILALVFGSFCLACAPVDEDLPEEDDTEIVTPNPDDDEPEELPDPDDEGGDQPMIPGEGLPW